MYIAITDTRVYTAKTLPMLNRSMNGMLEEDEFKQVKGRRKYFFNFYSHNLTSFLTLYIKIQKIFLEYSLPLFCSEQSAMMP